MKCPKEVASLIDIRVVGNNQEALEEFLKMAGLCWCFFVIWLQVGIVFCDIFYLQ